MRKSGAIQSSNQPISCIIKTPTLLGHIISGLYLFGIRRISKIFVEIKRQQKNRGDVCMKKYHVFITFKNGLKLDFHTDTDVRKVKPHITIHGK